MEICFNTNFLNNSNLITDNIFQSSNWQSTEPNPAQQAEDARDLFDGETISMVQGSRQLRQAVVQGTKDNRHAFSLSALRQSRVHNELLFEILLNKRLGHALHLEGKVMLEANHKECNLEGFNETFSLPMLASSFETFANCSQNESMKQCNEIFQKLFIMIISLMKKLKRQ